jgi:hypothetical protein
MPQTIDEEKFRERTTFDVSAPPNTPTGIPTKQIPHMEFPMVVYKHPTEPFVKILHRNKAHEIVHEEIQQAEALAMKVNDKKELKAALEDGWVQDVYIPEAIPDPNANLYASK